MLKTIQIYFIIQIYLTFNYLNLIIVNDFVFTITKNFK